ncbi:MULTISPECIES: hypothetical protein [Nocardiopsis]|uniref:Uncharacterized protein n=1 Tax=Nocardiopsis sinuspersici TaxID=501010 RepID=A0A1V3C634_9ACTN|nr:MULTISPECIES: hypothetical protein [Nocardiopsis]OOC55840.1 hypothetical protein NOSIN_20060 [Nocardiopsis sinuspersici]
MLPHTLPHMIGPVLSALLGAAGLACCFAAPRGRRALTGVGGGLVLFASAVRLVLVLLYQPTESLLSGLFGGRTAGMAVDGLDYFAHSLFATGLLLLVLGATRRPPRVRAPRPAHVPAGPYPPGPAAPRPHGPVQR